MSYGGRFVNDEGDFFISDWTRTLYYIGKAWLLRTVNTGGDTDAVFMQYRIHSQHRPVVFVHEPTYAWNIHSIYPREPGVWDVFIVSIEGAGPTLYCFNTHTSNPDGWGMIVWDGDGNVTFDSRHQPIRLRGVATAGIGDLDSGMTTRSHQVSGLSKPAMHSSLAGIQTLYFGGGGYVLTAFYMPLAYIDQNNIGAGWKYVGWGDAYPYFRYEAPDWDVPIIDGADYD